jgi:hypothetical protein
MRRVCELVVSLHRFGDVMGWMDLSDYALIEGAVVDRLDELRRARGVVPDGDDPTPAMARALYIAAALRARPRAIDRYIDYFGDCVPGQR